MMMEESGWFGDCNTGLDVLIEEIAFDDLTEFHVDS